VGKRIREQVPALAERKETVIYSFVVTFTGADFTSPDSPEYLPGTRESPIDTVAARQATAGRDDGVV
jgi:hypothetical protein